MILAVLEQVRGIEPPYSAWEADVLPLNYTCLRAMLNILSLFYNKSIVI